ncbi:MAG: hypothetical protein UHS41_07560 [Lachnospiraceae bacterium]|nr:hypothetical protein [Lachnospiraceae bacterium]
MLTLIFIILMFIVIGKIFGFAIKAAWGISKIICSVVFLPLFFLVLVIKGLIGIALSILLIVGFISLFVFRD